MNPLPRMRRAFGRVQTAAERAIEPKLRAAGLMWDGLGAGTFECWLLCQPFAMYTVLRRMARRHSGHTRRRLLAEANESRLRCREFGARFFDLLPADRVGLTALDAKGEDAELRAWFTPGVPLPRRAGRRRQRPRRTG